MKYRNNIKTNNVLEGIDSKTSIFSEKYFKNLSILKEMLMNKTISRNNESYKKHLYNFTLFLENNNIVNNIDDNNFKEIERLFYGIIMGRPIAILYKLSSIEEITIFNRLGKIDFGVGDFAVEQLENYNVKHHKQLCELFSENGFYYERYKQLILKLMLLVGFDNARIILDIDDTLPVLEHLVGSVDIKSVKLDEHGNPILNTKLMNILFSDKKHLKIKNMLSNKDNDLYKYFPRMFNEWEYIKLNNKDMSLKTIIEFLKSCEISLPPKYYRLKDSFKQIGCKSNIVSETLLLHDVMMNRIYSTIPRVKKIKDGYSYEILRLDDMESLVVGNKTDCCFTVLGNGYSCLKHALTSKNGRILVIKKRWRNISSQLGLEKWRLIMS